MELVKKESAVREPPLINTKLVLQSRSRERESEKAQIRGRIIERENTATKEEHNKDYGTK
jgi:hypothetical protein